MCACRQTKAMAQERTRRQQGERPLSVSTPFHVSASLHETRIESYSYLQMR
jgi:hypothetical protein